MQLLKKNVRAHVMMWKHNLHILLRKKKKLVMHSMIPLPQTKTKTRNVYMFIHDDMNKEKGAGIVHTNCLLWLLQG